MIALEQFKQIINNDTNEWYDAIIDILPLYEINSDKRIAMFLAQTCHESSNYTRLIENLNYSEQGLLKIFPKYFNATTAKHYTRKPELIANKVYAFKIGNGDEKSGDGWKYRGRGIIQITGRDNYKKYSKIIFDDERLLNNPNQVIDDKKLMITLACEFWKNAGLNQFCDKEDIKTVTKRINGGYNGLEDRSEKYKKYLEILNS